MASKNGSGGKQRHIKARISYLYRAANLFSEATQENTIIPETSRITGVKSESQGLSNGQLEKSTSFSTGNSGRHFMSQLRSVSLKSQIRLSSDIKHHLCKKCSTPLQDGRTSYTRIENPSRKGQKVWADVKVTTCLFCGTSKRFPSGLRRQTKRKQRRPAANDAGVVLERKTMAADVGR